MSLSCFRTVQQNTVDQVYDANSEAGSMYLGSGAPPLCSSTDLPSSSGCVVCFQQFVYTVCFDLLKNVTLVMEGGGQAIDFTKSECPSFSDTNEKADLTGVDTGASKWWLLLLLLVPVIIFLLVAAWKNGKYRNYLRAQPAVDSSEQNPEAESPV